MDKTKIKKAVSSQVGKFTDEALDQVKKKPARKLTDINKILGLGKKEPVKPPPPITSARPTVPASAEDLKSQLAAREAQDKKKSQQEITRLKKELEEEIEKYRRVREEQLKARQQAAGPQTSEEEIKNQKRQSILDKAKSSRPKGPQGMVAGLRARARKTKAELSGSRRSG